MRWSAMIALCVLGEVAVSAATSATKPRLRVVSYNIRAGIHFSGLAPLKRVLRSLHEQAAHGHFLAGLQEVDRFAERSGGVDQVEEMAAALGMSGHFFEAFAPSAAAPDWQYGNALLSDLSVPAANVQLHRLPHALHPDWPDWISEPRVVGHARIDLFDQTIAFFVTHLGLLPEHRQLQFARLEELLGAVSDLPVIVSLDSNGGIYPAREGTSGAKLEYQASTRDECAAFCAETGLTDALASREALEPSYPTPHPSAPLDRIFVRGFRVIHATVHRDAPPAASDHYPVIADLELE